MRHEIRDSNSLVFTLEVVIGGTAITGLSPTVTIRSVNNNNHWSAAGTTWGIAVANPMGPLSLADQPGLYFFDASTAFGHGTGGGTESDRGYILKMEESIHNILEYVYVVISDTMVSSASLPPIVDANVVQWDGSASAVELGSVTGFPAVSVQGWGEDGSLNLVDTYVQTSSGGHDVSGNNLPAITVAGWGGDVSANLSIGLTTKVPEISVKGWNDLAGNYEDFVIGEFDSSINVMFPCVNVDKWNGFDVTSTTNDGLDLPNVNVADWGDTSGNATLIVGETSNLPQIGVAAWTDASANDDVFTFYSPGGNDVSRNLPAITVFGWGGDASANISIGPRSSTPRITVLGWEGDQIDASNNDILASSSEIGVTWTQDHDTSGVIVDRPNVRTQIIANNAIDEDAIHIDSVTYEEISATAAQEISDAVWNADIFNSIYRPDPADSTDFSYAAEMSIGRAMLIQYLSQNVNHWGTNSESPMHICNHTDASGTKFYSNRLSTWPLTEDEIISYVDRSIIIVKDLVFSNAPGGDLSFSAITESYLGRITGVDEDGHGQYFEVKLVNEDESPVPDGFGVGTDVLIVKAETDATMHEVAHEVWEESVFDHETPDTFGMFNRIMTGLTQFNHRITDSIYDESGRLLSCRLVVYASSEDAANEENALTTIEVTSTYDEKQNMQTFLAKEEADSDGS